MARYKMIDVTGKYEADEFLLDVAIDETISQEDGYQYSVYELEEGWSYDVEGYERTFEDVDFKLYKSFQDAERDVIANIAEIAAMEGDNDEY